MIEIERPEVSDEARKIAHEHNLDIDAASEHLYQASRFLANNNGMDYHDAVIASCMLMEGSAQSRPDHPVLQMLINIPPYIETMMRGGNILANLVCKANGWDPEKLGHDTKRMYELRMEAADPEKFPLKKEDKKDEG
jgi:hypothetical protein